MAVLPKQLIVIGDSSVYGWGDTVGGGWGERLRKDLSKFHDFPIVWGSVLFRKSGFSLNFLILVQILLEVDIFRGFRFLVGGPRVELRQNLTLF